MKIYKKNKTSLLHYSVGSFCKFCKKVGLAVFSTFMYLPLLVQAQETAGLVAKVVGNAFCVRAQKVLPLKEGSYLEYNDEILTEEKAQIVFSDLQEREYILASSSQLHIQKNKWPLSRGYLWIKAKNSPSTPFKILTANAIMEFQHTSAILSYDNVSAKSQVLVISGESSLANLIEHKQFTLVHAGEFSFIDNSRDLTRPRDPTFIGYGSFRKVMELFSDIDLEKAMNDFKESTQRENPAVVSAPTEGVDHKLLDTENALVTEKNEMFRLAQEEVKHLPDSPKFAPEEFLKEQWQEIKKQKKANKSGEGNLKQHHRLQREKKKNSIVLHIYGVGRGVGKMDKLGKVVESKQVESNFRGHRSPSGIKKEELSLPVEHKKDHKQEQNHEVQHDQQHGGAHIKTKEEVAAHDDAHKNKHVLEEVKPIAVDPDKVFEASLEQKQKGQQRHPEEVNQLIHQLKTYNQDYKTNF